jgi:DNA processing protein
VGPIIFSRLLNQFPNLQTLFDNPSLAKGLSEEIRQGLAKSDWQQVQADLDWLSHQGRHLITFNDPCYPELLKQISDPPPLLFAQGDVDLLSEWQLAIVGSRSASKSGSDLAYEFGRYLAKGGMAVTSGLASGIDTAAHQGALSVSGPTIAVVGTGLDRVYPAQNRDLAHRIAETGLIISEFALGTPPKAENFPRRNRIISGLSLGTLVVEAALKSGSLITARMALEQGREVFAIPGSIHNPLAKGCHQLIREGAKLVETAKDILEELGAIAAFESSEQPTLLQQQKTANNDSDYQALFKCMGYDPIEIDRLVACSGLTAESVSSMLLLLELQGEVESLPGGRYVRVSA